jgi:hypothetical protein
MSPGEGLTSDQPPSCADQARRRSQECPTPREVWDFSFHLGPQVRELLVQMMKHHHPRVEVRGLSPENTTNFGPPPACALVRPGERGLKNVQTVGYESQVAALGPKLSPCTWHRFKGGSQCKPKCPFMDFPCPIPRLRTSGEKGSGSICGKKNGDAALGLPCPWVEV